MIAHCLFEQSGTFKNAFKKYGIEAYDYDIQNEFKETDYVTDLFKEIEGGYQGEPSLFDKISPDDLILAFFPCTRFEQQILLWFRGDSKQQKNDNELKKLEKDLVLHSELSKNYSMITKLAIVCLRKNIPLVFENPYSEQHYLQKYWCLKPTIIDRNRRDNGDYYNKPTQYWFIGFQPKNNLVFEPIDYVEQKKINDLWGTKKEDVAERSMIHPQYADRFIRQYILDEVIWRGKET